MLSVVLLQVLGFFLVQAQVERDTLFHEGFDMDAAGAVARKPLDNGFSLWMKLEHDRCMTAISASAAGTKPITVRASKIARYNPDTGYVWTQLTEDFTVTSDSGNEQHAFTSTYCGYQLKLDFTSEADITLKDVYLYHDLALLAERQENEKRNSFSPAPVDSTDNCNPSGIYFADSSGTQQGCGQSNYGGLCLSTGFCGCTHDHDCFTASGKPYCNVDPGNTEGACDKCKYQSQNQTLNHYWCRNRFPTDFLFGQNLPQPYSLWISGFNFGNEVVAGHWPANGSTILNSFREACDAFSSSDGGCVSCASAVGGDSTYATIFAGPQYQNNSRLKTSTQKSGAFGTYHCNLIRPDLPICSSTDYFQVLGIPLTSTVRLLGKNLNPLYTNATGGEGIDTVIKYKGACLPCAMDFNGGTNFANLHSLCALALPSKPICTGSSCRACATNADCNQSPNCNSTATCPDPIGLQTTSNCNADGSCSRCVTNADCGIKDGGENISQTVCDVPSGQCVYPFICTNNSACIARNASLPNCQADGTCTYCTTTSCGLSKDGGETPAQPVCNLGTGICFSCASNSDCSLGNQGANCQADGSCYNCTSSPNSCATGTTSANDGPPPGNTAQTLCDINNTRTCVSPFSCSNNSQCSTQPGANCQANHLCVNCVVSYTSTTCSANDGGETPGQPNCNQTTRLCVANCTQGSTNSDCVGTQGANCMANGVCFNCRNNSDCAVTAPWLGDLGNSRQCDPTSGICFDCNAQSTSGNQQGNCPAGTNCQSDGTCKACSGAADCLLDGGFQNGQTVCSSGICIPACDGNFGISSTNPCTSSAANCDKDGICRSCTASGYPGCSANDGPPPAGTNTVCDTSSGICVDPYNCSGKAGAQGGCPTGRNCQLDGTCVNCSSGNNLCSNDGGAIAGQPTCSPSTGLCGPCNGNFGSGSSSPCPSTLPNCNLDGSCLSCTKDAQCGATDGPNALAGGTVSGVADQPYCDTINHVCVQYCTEDNQCTDPCQPYCAINKGCCVECTANAHCPHTDTSNGGLAWRATDATRTYCDFDYYMCTPPPPACSIDADCNNTSGKPACSTSQGFCVECVFNSHCSGSTPACHTASQTCVACTADADCKTGDVCHSDNTCLLAGVSTATGLVSFGMAIFASFLARLL